MCSILYAAGFSSEQILAELPDLERDSQPALRYAARGSALPWISSRFPDIEAFSVRNLASTVGRRVQLSLPGGFLAALLDQAKGSLSPATCPIRIRSA